MTKYKKAVSEMLEYNQDLFNTFRNIHSLYEEDPKVYQEQFNKEGEKALRVIRRYENIVCGKSELSNYSKFSSNLADKFWSEVRLVFPKIDFIGQK